jgi:hypothetical protein
MGMPTNAQSEAFGVFRPQRPVNRAEPILPPQAMKTYGIACPIPTHFREATCEEVLCPQHVSGWRTVCSTKTELGVQQIKYIREQSGRHFTITGPDQAGDVAFIFPPGQKCFGKHAVTLEREAIYYVVEGDYRGNPRNVPVRKHVSGENWLDDFATHQGKLADELAKG